MKEITYKDAGVDIFAGNKAVQLIKKFTKSTFRKEVLTDIGGFSGLFLLNLKKYKEPVLVSSCDGVGTKLKIAFSLNKHDTVGIDLVAMCVDDLIVCGAEPLFFLDYLACSKLNPLKVAKIVKGVAKGCKIANCSLIGGEMAELPDFYKEEEYDLAGFAVGIVEKKKIIDGRNIKLGDKIIGLASSGLHSNGYSLARKLILEIKKYKLKSYVQELDKTIGEELLIPTKIYAPVILKLLRKFDLKGVAHITGGGFIENIPRILPARCYAEIHLNSWETSTIFNILQDIGNISQKEMFKTFNMGIGMVLIATSEQTDKVLRELKRVGEKAYLIGEIKKGEGKINFINV